MEPCVSCGSSIDGIFKVHVSNNLKKRVLGKNTLNDAKLKDQLDICFTDIILEEEYRKTLFILETCKIVKTCCLSQLNCEKCIHEKINRHSWKKVIYQFTLKLLQIEQRLFNI